VSSPLAALVVPGRRGAPTDMRLLPGSYSALRALVTSHGRFFARRLSGGLVPQPGGNANRLVCVAVFELASVGQPGEAVIAC
jgi:hypothetical protein